MCNSACQSSPQRRRPFWIPLCWGTFCRHRWGVTTATQVLWLLLHVARSWSGLFFGSPFPFLTIRCVYFVSEVHLFICPLEENVLKPAILILRTKMFLLTKKEVAVIFFFVLSNIVSEREPSVLWRQYNMKPSFLSMIYLVLFLLRLN